MTFRQKLLTAAAAMALVGVPLAQQIQIRRLQVKVSELGSSPRTPEAEGKRVVDSARKQGLSDVRNLTPVFPPEATATPPQVVASGTGHSRPSRREAVDHALVEERTATEGALLLVTRSEWGAEPVALGGEVVDLVGRYTSLPTLENGKVRWDHAQATGVPDTPQAGDIPTAWAPREARSGEQWLQVGYERTVEISEVTIHESHSAGAISRVAAVMPDGTERVFWTGNMAVEQSGEILETSVPVPPGLTSREIRVYVDTNRVASWPEIDAVELVGVDGSRQWASESSASSSYSELYNGVDP